MRIFTFFCIRSTILLTSILLLQAGDIWGQDVQVTASVESETVGVQDQFELSVTVSGKDSGDAEAPRMQSLRNFKVVSGPSVGSQYQWVNGRTSSSKSFTYLLIPEKEGQFTIDPVEVRVGGRSYKTQPLQIRVTSAPRPIRSQQQRRSLSPLDPFDPYEQDEASRDSRTEPDRVLIRAELDRSSAYPGQQITLSYRVYTQVSINGFQLRESPPLSGFWVEDLEVDREPKPTRQVLNGREYLAFVVKKQALFATGPGRLKIPSSIFAFSAETGGGLLGVFRQSETVYRKTDEISLDIKPLPASGRPLDYANAVGSFSISSSVDKRQAATGDAVALQIKLEGKGNLKMIPDIAAPSLPDFSVYSSKRTDSIHPVDGNQMGGNKLWEYVIVPKAPGRQSIPPASFSFFDPEEGRYKSITTEPITLNVAPGNTDTAAGPGLSGGNKQDLVRRGSDINFIKLSGDFDANSVPLYRSPWFYAVAFVPLAFNLAVVFTRMQRSRNAGNESILRSRKAKRKAFEKLASAEKTGGAQARQFYDGAAAALSGFLCDRFELSQMELTGDGLERALSGYSISPEILEETRACLQECDFGRFVSASGSGEKMRALNLRIQKNIEELDKIPRIPAARSNL